MSNDRGLEPPMNLKGFVLGNPFTDRKYDLNSRVAFAHENALVSDELYESTKEHCMGEYMHPDRSNVLCISNVQAVNKSFGKLYAYNIMEPKCNKWNLRHLLQKDFTDCLSTPEILEEWCREYNLVFSNIWANDKSVQNALHVREGTINKWERCNSSLKYKRDVRSSLEYQRNFTEGGYRALIYSGDHDAAIPYLGTHSWIRSLNLSTAKDWQPWFVDGQVAGYVITYSKDKYRLTFATVKGAGHTAAEYKPRECFAMIDRWLAYSPL